MTFEFTERKLDEIMTRIHSNTYETAEEFGVSGNYVAGANLLGFVKVARRWSRSADPNGPVAANPLRL